MKVKMKQGKQNKIENSSRREFSLLETLENKAENSKLEIICSGRRGSGWKEHEDGGERGVLPCGIKLLF